MTAMPKVAPAADWAPPAGMPQLVVSGWRAFYRHIWDVYGMAPGQYRAIYLAQLGRCYICQRARGMHPDDPKGGGGRRLGVDHNHAYGNRIEAVRGLLCNWGDKSCNRIIGWLTPEALNRARAYMAEMPAQEVMRALANGAEDDLIQGMAVHER